jgi:hypothetical protein
MVTTVTVNADYDNLTIGKNLTPQSALTSKMRTAVLDVAFDCMTPYTTGGLTVDLTACGRISTIITAVPANGPDGLLLKYVADCCPVDCASSGTLLAFQTATCMAPLVELCACDTDLQCQTIRFNITGF